MKEANLVYGVGVNDANYKLTIREPTGTLNKDSTKKYKIVWRCPYYVKWFGMLKRCYSKKFKTSNPTYKGCSVCLEWLTFSNFKTWVKSQGASDWDILQLDKDLLVEGNKVYSPTTCVLVSSRINTFILDSAGSRSLLSLGVYPSLSTTNPYSTQCRDPLKRYSPYVGLYRTEAAAHQAWQQKKHEYSCELAEFETDIRVKQVLLTKYKEGTIHE